MVATRNDRAMFGITRLNKTPYSSSAKRTSMHDYFISKTGTNKKKSRRKDDEWKETKKKVCFSSQKDQAKAIALSQRQVK